MSSSNSQPRLSIDLGAPTLKTIPTEVDISQPTGRIHPARLQHSPSLPNIWFPPHSGPIPPEIMSKDFFLRPSTPPAATTDEDLLIKHSPTISSIQPPRLRAKHVPTEPHAHFVLGPDSIKPQRRRRREREQPVSLLTPPLTPSSSIRTTTSLDSSASHREKLNNDKDDADTFSEIRDPDTKSTRFLLLGNVNDKVSPDVLKSAVVSALSASLSDSPNAHVSRSYHPEDGPVKGVNHRFQKSKGIVPFIFNDIRLARAAKECLSVPRKGPLEECIGNEIREDGICWITTQFLTVEELTSLIGNSSYIESSDGSFYISARVDASAPGKQSNVEIIVDKEKGNRDSNRNAISVGAIQNILKSYGDLYSFSFAREEVEKDGSVSKTFRVEYYDLREADDAFIALDQQTMFGMRIHVYGRKVQSDDVSYQMPGLSIGPAGQQSQIRTQFGHTEGAEQNTSGPTHGARSPQYFYTSPANGDSPNITKTPTLTRNVHDDVVDGHSYPSLYQPTNESHKLEAQSTQDGTILQWEAELRPDATTVCYTPTQECRYCPSRGPSIIPYFPQHTPPPSLTYSHPLPVPPIIVNPPPTPTAFVYEHDCQSIQPVMPHWAFEQAMALAASNGVYSGLAGSFIPRPFWSPDISTGFLPARSGFYPGHIPSPDPRQVEYFPVTTEMQGAALLEPPFPHGQRTSAQRSPSPVTRVTSLQQAASTITHATAPSGTPERNQLNLDRIQDGQDTRTTVMIKNIPNKMSDKDLVAYIGKVCPKKIDFLYLRMDFQNGCNVGYAFVNFIRVEDLLVFAQKKLGERWNMFSSEKVLQMSYANYQGKEALVEKFKNSCIMDEREAWRPKIFYSSGPEQGLPEPFPAPTHIRRKERSSINRGGLFTPGAGNGLPSPQPGPLHDPDRRHQDSHRSQRPQQRGRAVHENASDASRNACNRDPR